MAELVAVMKSLGQKFELIFVDDCSTDASWATLAEIARADARATAIRLAENVGQGRATVVGLGRSLGEIIITLDDDLQHAPEDIPTLLAELNGPAHYDAVFGVPISRRHPIWRRLASWTLNCLLSLVMRKPLALRLTGFRVLRRSVAQPILSGRWPNPFLSTILFQITPHISAVRVEHSDSGLVSSRYSIRKLLLATLGCLGSLSDHNLRKITFCTFAAGLILLMVAWSAVSFAPPGFATMAVVALAAALGILGFTFGLALAAIMWRVKAVQREATAAIGIRYVISDGRKVTNDG